MLDVVIVSGRVIGDCYRNTDTLVYTATPLCSPFPFSLIVVVPMHPYRTQIDEIEQLTGNIRFQANKKDAKDEASIQLLKAENREKELKREMKLLKQRMANEQSRALRLAANVGDVKKTMK